MAISQHPLTPWGKMLEAERQHRGWSHDEVTRRAGLGSPSTWNTVVYGGREDKGQFKEVTPRPDTLARLAVALGMDVKKVLKKAGYSHIPFDIEYKLSHVPSEQLWGELRHRGELTKGIENVLTRRSAQSQRHAGSGQPPD